MRSAFLAACALTTFASTAFAAQGTPAPQPQTPACQSQQAGHGATAAPACAQSTPTKPTAAPTTAQTGATPPKH